NMIVSAACIQIAGITKPAPDNHLVASPHCPMCFTSCRCVDYTSGCPAIRVRAISASSVQVIVVSVKENPAPDDHASTGPHRGMGLPADRCIGGGGRYPAIRNRIVSAARVHITVDKVKSAPQDHLTARPDGCRQFPGSRCICSGGRYPAICSRIVSAARIQITVDKVISAPHDHFAASPNCCVVCPCIRHIACAGR